MLARWFVPVITVLVLLAQSASTFAMAGVKRDIVCCCPDPDVCKCHGHDDPTPTPEMKRCGGAVHEVAPAQIAATLSAPPTMIAATTAIEVVVVELPISDEPTSAPETPPF